MAATPRLVRPSLTAPALDKPTAKHIRFIHPGYSAPNNVLFRLARVDPATDPDTLGVFHATALIACQIVANNAWSGRLALDKHGQKSVETGLDYCCPLYPVVPSFRDWPFPHDRIPGFWPSVPVTGHTTDTCILTDSSYSRTDAHLVPREEGDWFKYNCMGQYGLDRKDTEDSANLISLRADVHVWLDARGWTITPKAAPAPEGHQYVANVLDPVQSPEFFSWYHNVRLRLSGRQATEYVFARFAWTVMQLVKPFVISTAPRAIVHVRADPEKAVEWVVETMHSDQLDKLYAGGGSRSASPNKRRKSSTRASSAHNGSSHRITTIFDRVTAHHAARVQIQKAERAAMYDRVNPPAVKKRRSSEIDAEADAADDLLDDWEIRGRPRKRRSWMTGDASSISIASLGHSCSTVQSDVDDHEVDEHDINDHDIPPLETPGGHSIHAHLFHKVSTERDIHVCGDQDAIDEPPERDKEADRISSGIAE